VTERVCLRAASGARIGLGHAMRTRAVAREIVALGGRPLAIVDDALTARLVAGGGVEAAVEAERPEWASEPATAVWLDGYRDWSDALRTLERATGPRVVVENRTAARELCDRVVYPSLHHRDDAWDRAHAAAVLSGARWIPLAREVREAGPREERDVDLLIAFGGSDPARLTERALALLAGTHARVAVVVGPHASARRPAIERLASALPRGEVVPAAAPLAAWMARSRVALTALGTSLYELAWLRVPALVLANYASDRAALAHYAADGPHRPLGVAGELDDDELRRALARGVEELATRRPAPVEGLGEGAQHLARLLLAR
jgi:spore coat polysaccharide biosynthesis predicted glycosyltransferase SpsG